MPPKAKNRPCIRCPTEADAELNRHSANNNFEKCRKDYPIDHDKPGWWPFSEGPVPDDLNLDDAQTCYALLEHAKEVDDQSKVPKPSNKDFKDWADNMKSTHKAATFRNFTITRKMLEKALDKLVTSNWQPPTQGSFQALSEASGAGPSTADADITGIVEKTARTVIADTAGSQATPATALSPTPATSSSANSSGPNNGQGPTIAVSDIVRYCKPGESHRDQAAQVLSLPDPKNFPGTTSQAVETNELKSLKKNADKYPKLVKTQKKLKSQAKNRSANQLGKDEMEYFPLRSKFAVDDSHAVLTNHFVLNIPKTAMLYEYRVIGMPDSCTRSKRRVLILDMLELDRSLADNRSILATDYFDKIISIGKLHPEGKVEGDQFLEVIVPNFNPGIRDDNTETRNLSLRFSTTHSLKRLHDYVRREDESYMDRGATEALNIIMSKALSENKSQKNGKTDIFLAGKNRFYYRPGWFDLQGLKPENQGLIGVRGYFTKIKPGCGAILLNINTVTSLFYKPECLSEYLKPFAKGSKNEDSQGRKCKAHLTGLRVRINFDRGSANPGDPTIDKPSRRVKTLASIGDYPEKQEIVVDGHTTTVWNHILQKYDAYDSAEDPNLNTCNVGNASKGKEKFYLASQLTVLPDQMYRRTPVPPEVTETMIKQARRTPQENRNAIVEEGLTLLHTKGKVLPSMLQTLGITLDRRMLAVSARLIPGPSITFKGIAAGNAAGFWSFPKTPFYFNSSGFSFSSMAGTASKNPKVQFFRPSGAMKYPKQERQYLVNFQKLHAVNGLPRLTPLNNDLSFEKISDWNVDSLKVLLGNFKDKIGLAVVVFPDASASNRDDYASFRVAADQYLGMKSICLNEERMCSSVKAGANAPPLGDDQLADYMRNISMKLNLRCGNSNHTVQFGKTSKVGSDTLVLGADVTHPSTGSTRFTPSIAAVVGSIDATFALFPGSMRLNPSRQEAIEEMESMAYERILAFHKSNGKLPQSVLYYRDSVSESYYAEVRKKELNAIRKAWAKVKENTKAIVRNDVKITAVVVTKRHHTRIYPPEVEQQDKGRNCAAGTVVESGITSPYYEDFYLLSHNVRQGTGRPAHYLVIENEMGLQPKELQDFTFHLCHTYCRGNNAVSYAPPAYYADRLCERGRLYLHPFHAQMKKAAADKDDQSTFTEGEIMAKAKNHFYPHNPDRNPWHGNHDGKMFWM